MVRRLLYINARRELMKLTPRVSMVFLFFATALSPLLCEANSGRVLHCWIQNDERSNIIHFDPSDKDVIDRGTVELNKDGYATLVLKTSRFVAQVIAYGSKHLISLNLYDQVTGFHVSSSENYLSAPSEFPDVRLASMKAPVLNVHLICDGSLLVKKPSKEVGSPYIPQPPTGTKSDAE
jgi:hypothetical protein